MQPALQVPQKQQAMVGACVATFFGGLERQQKVREWLLHMQVSICQWSQSMTITVRDGSALLHCRLSMAVWLDDEPLTKSASRSSLQSFRCSRLP